MLAALRRKAIDGTRLYVLLDQCESRQAFSSLVAMLVDAGVGAVQLRAKRLDDRELLVRARLLRELTSQSQTLFVVNDRPDVAVLAEADGVHLGQDDVQVADARRIIGGQCLVGVSTHCLDQARQAIQDGADYIGCGPTFASTTKQFEDFPGLDYLRSVCGLDAPPAFAIGGIQHENLPWVLQTGFRRIAVGSAVVDAEDPAGQVRELNQLLHRPPHAYRRTTM